MKKYPSPVKPTQPTGKAAPTQPVPIAPVNNRAKYDNGSV